MRKFGYIYDQMSWTTLQARSDFILDPRPDSSI